MSSNKKERESSKKRFAFFSRKPKTTNPLANSPSIDNSVKIPAMTAAAGIADTINAAIRSNSKKGHKSKSGGKSKHVEDPQDFDPAKPKNLAKLFKKYGDREISEPKKENFPPQLSPALSETGAIGMDGALKSDVAEQGATAFDNDALDNAALKIQTAFRGQKYRRLYLSSRRKVIKVQALVRGVLARKRVAELKIAANTDVRAIEEGPEN